MYRIPEEKVIEIAAKAAHEVNRIYCLGIDDLSQLSWDDSPDWQKESVRYGVHNIIKHSDITPEHLHEEWLKFKAADGWKYGPVKDIINKEHPCFLPYKELPVQHQVKDTLFISIVKAVLEAYKDIEEKKHPVDIYIDVS